MPSLLEDPDQWHARAAEARAIAADMKDAASRREMMEIADRYDRLAERAALRRKLKS